MAERINITTPVGRLVGGDLYTPQTTDHQGAPLTMKDKVTPRVDYSFGVAIPKTPGVQHWANEPWGTAIWAYGWAAFPNGEAQRPDFSWKITDGDSAIPNKAGRKPCDREGYKGHWVIWFSGGFAPGIYNADGSQKILEKDAVKPGYYVQVFGNISDNKPSQSPGIYVNHTYVALSAYGEEIQTGPDVSAAGFGGAPLPPGASATPPAGNFNPAPPPAPPAGYAPPPAPPAPGPAVAPPPAPPVVPVQPNPAILTPPPGPAVAPPPPPVVAAPVGDARNARLTPAANGATYEQLVVAGWTDATLIQNGLMTP